MFALACFGDTWSNKQSIDQPYIADRLKDKKMSFRSVWKPQHLFRNFDAENRSSRSEIGMWRCKTNILLLGWSWLMYPSGMGPLLRNASITNNTHYWEASPITTLIIITDERKSINFNTSSLMMGSSASITIHITHWWSFLSFHLIINYCYVYRYISIVIINPQKSTIPITLPLLMTQISYIFISLPITGKTKYSLLNFWRLSVPIFITHSLLQRVNNSWIYNKKYRYQGIPLASGQSRKTLCFNNENLCFDS